MCVCVYSYLYSSFLQRFCRALSTIPVIAACGTPQANWGSGLAVTFLFPNLQQEQCVEIIQGLLISGHLSRGVYFSLNLMQEPSNS